MSNDRYYVLDTFRGFAALAVACGHFGMLPSRSYIFAVDFFLVLSGFVLTHSYFLSRRISFRDFVLRRFFRMYPLHAFSFLLCIAFYLIVGRDIVPRDFLLHLFFVQNLGFGPNELTFNWPAWTISVEFWLNVAVYAAILIIRPGPRTVMIWSAIGIAACYYILFRATGFLNVLLPNYFGFLNSGLIRCLGAFLVGIMAYYLYLRLQDWQLSKILMLSALLVFAGIILGLRGGSVYGFATPFLFGGIVVVFAKAHGSAQRLLAKGAYLGDISFSIYLMHFPIILVFWHFQLQETYWGVLVFPPLVLTIAALVYRYFEKPSYKWLLRVSQAARSSSAVATIK